MVLIVALPSTGIVVYSGIKLRQTAVQAALLETDKICAAIAEEQKNAAQLAEQLMTALSQVPEIRKQRSLPTRKILRRIQELSPLYLNVAVLDANGTVWASAIDTGPISAVDRAYFQRAMATGQLASGECIMSRFAAVPTINLCYPYKGDDGTLAGALTISFHLEHLSAQLTEQHSAHYRYTLLDRNGVVVAKSGSAALQLGTQEHPAIFHRMQRDVEQGSFVETGADQIPCYVSFRKLRLNGEAEPYLYVSAWIPVASTAAQVDALLLRNLLLLLVCLGCAMLLAGLIGKVSIFDPVGLLRETSQRLAQGDLAVRVADRLPGGELMELGRTFDEMAQRLEAREQERQSADQALRLSESRYRSIFENSLFGIVTVGPDGCFQRVNEAFCRMLGYREEELVGVCSVAQVTHPEDASYASDKHRALVEGGLKRYTVEKRYLTRSGGVLQTACCIERTERPEGGWNGYTGCILDLTDMKDNQERMRLFFERQTVGMAITTPEKQWLQTNARLQQQLGYSAEELARLTWEDLTHPEDLEKSLQQYRQMLEGQNDEYVIQVRYLHKTNRAVHFIISIGCVRRHNGDVDYVLALYDDITERTKAEQEIQLLQACLEQRVQERTAQLEAAVNEQEAFSYSVSHDLRSPLRHINSYLAILQEECGGALPEKAHNYLNRARNASIKMGKLIDGLLELSRVSRYRLNKETVDLSALACETTTLLQEADPDRKVRLEIGSGITAEGDKILLGQVLANLLGNAWKYTGRTRNPRVSFGLTETDRQQAYYVRDNGTGFDMEYSDKLFGAFQRLHGEEYEGTGIGLATVKRIIERHGGRVWAVGAPDRGATFYFTLP
jgi:PAS domain S-box-containing protein